jgi:hypothetical protein
MLCYSFFCFLLGVVSVFFSSVGCGVDVISEKGTAGGSERERPPQTHAWLPISPASCTQFDLSSENLLPCFLLPYSRIGKRAAEH